MALFQSLSGFQVRCNCVYNNERIMRSCSFNPYRVFKFAATELHLGHRSGFLLVSIPIGFSSSLQPPGQLTNRAPPTSFNPYRVFKFAATKEQDKAREKIKQFQSLSGFQVRCNTFLQCWRTSTWAPAVSIPIGFSSSLQLPYNAPAFCICIGFQSLSGFQVRCNPVL